VAHDLARRSLQGCDQLHVDPRGSPDVFGHHAGI
jgi:hypothetical protein